MMNKEAHEARIKIHILADVSDEANVLYMRITIH